VSKVVRPAQERSRQTRDLLVDATLDCLQEFGFHGASLSRILDRAGISKGTWAHHFATRNELIAAAAEVMIADTRRAADDFAAQGAEHRRDGSLIEQVWQRFYQSRYRDVLFEMTVACRTEPDLRARLQPVFAGLIGGLRDAWSGADERREMAANITTLTVYMLRGMAMQDMLARDPVGGATLRRLWADLMMPFIDADLFGRAGQTDEAAAES
jgi:AcrR family transcriptional regulator